MTGFDQGGHAQHTTLCNPRRLPPTERDESLEAMATLSRRRPGEGPDRLADLKTAAEVLRIEADGLGRLACSIAPGQPLGDSLVEALDAIERLPGRIVVCGIGKSGHVGRKIQATLASTGTPSLFVHPAEASHGDLGMIQPGDAVLVLSNSGETAELADVVGHCKRFGLTLIAMTAKAGSTLARAADIVLALPDAPEACPMGLAPTTSTTMQLALGDALAVALLDRRGFTASDFGLFHPGGRLGARLRRVSELMHDGEMIPLASPELPMLQAVMLMSSKAFGCLGIIGEEGGEAGALVGIITDGDLRRAIDPGPAPAAGRDLRALRAGDVMNAAPLTIGPDMLAAEALHLMNARARPITSLFVVDGARRPIGILHVHDLLRAGIA